MPRSRQHEYLQGWQIEIKPNEMLKDGERGRNRTYNLLIKSQRL
jgi:hypothetical protein